MTKKRRTKSKRIKSLQRKKISPVLKVRKSNSTTPEISSYREEHVEKEMEEKKGTFQLFNPDFVIKDLWKTLLVTGVIFLILILVTLSYT